MYAAALVAIDFSPTSRLLLKRLARLERLGTRKVVLLHVLPKGGDSEDALERLEAKAAKLGSTFNVECVVREGKPAQSILAVAEELDIPLIVLAARNHSLAHRLVLGSVADEVIHWTTRAVLLEDAFLDDSGEPRGIPQGPVLIATDGSETSTAAETLAIALARNSGINVVSVVNGESLQQGYEITAAVVARAEQRGVVARRNVETGRPGDSIARIAALNGASLIVVGRRATAKRGLGSTAQTICERANRPVLLVPAA